MDLISNWDEVKSKINSFLFFESDISNLSIKMVNIILGPKDRAIKTFMETADDLCDELLQRVFKTQRVDDLPFEFIAHKKYGELKFHDKLVFDTTLAIFEAIFLGDIVKDYVQGNKIVIDNFVKKLEQKINNVNT